MTEKIMGYTLQYAEHNKNIKITIDSFGEKIEPTIIHYYEKGGYKKPQFNYVLSHAKVIKDKNEAEVLKAKLNLEDSKKDIKREYLILPMIDRR